MITGTGTELDPYIVHSYDEINAFITDSDSGALYGKLGNDIDCISYGTNWEWETIAIPSGGGERYLDLDNHTIRNIHIQSSNYLFEGLSDQTKVIVSNGNIIKAVRKYTGTPLELYTDFTNVYFESIGTSDKPYIVHNYSEMKEACEYENYDSGTSTYGTNYVKLANDIDCNDYGSAWEWETIEITSKIETGYHSPRHYGELDLDGHTIKNVYIKTGNTYSLFNGTTESNVHKGIVKNGKILNVFINASKNHANRVKFVNISFSGNHAAITDSYVFYGCGFYSCAIYLESANHGNKGCFGGTPTIIENCDIEVHLNKDTNATRPSILLKATNTQLSISNSRITGDVTGETEIISNTAYTICNVTATNCVFEVDIDGYTLKDTLQTTQVIYNSPTSVINDAAVLPWMTVGTTIAAPSGEAMRSATSLTNLGFTVVPRE